LVWQTVVDYRLIMLRFVPCFGLRLFKLWIENPSQNVVYQYNTGTVRVIVQWGLDKCLVVGLTPSNCMLQTLGTDVVWPVPHALIVKNLAKGVLKC
jgi:hypothetical protein